jgi:hypothetical protein
MFRVQTAGVASAGSAREQCFTWNVTRRQPKPAVVALTDTTSSSRGFSVSVCQRLRRGQKGFEGPYGIRFGRPSPNLCAESTGEDNVLDLRSIHAALVFVA